MPWLGALNGSRCVAFNVRIVERVQWNGQTHFESILSVLGAYIFIRTFFAVALSEWTTPRKYAHLRTLLALRSIWKTQPRQTYTYIHTYMRIHLNPKPYGGSASLRGRLSSSCRSSPGWRLLYSHQRLWMIMRAPVDRNTRPPVVAFSLSLSCDHRPIRLLNARSAPGQRTFLGEDRAPAWTEAYIYMCTFKCMFVKFIHESRYRYGAMGGKGVVWCFGLLVVFYLLRVQGKTMNLALFGCCFSIIIAAKCVCVCFFVCW